MQERWKLLPGQTTPHVPIQVANKLDGVCSDEDSPVQVRPMLYLSCSAGYEGTLALHLGCGTFFMCVNVLTMPLCVGATCDQWIIAKLVHARIPPQRGNNQRYMLLGMTGIFQMLVGSYVTFDVVSGHLQLTVDTMDLTILSLSNLLRDPQSQVA